MKKNHDMFRLSFTVFGEAQPSGSKTAGVTKTGKRFYRDANPKSYPWKNDVATAAGLAMKARMAYLGPVAVSASFFFRRPKAHYRTRAGKPTGEVKPNAPSWKLTKPDLDKVMRAIKDGMSGVVYNDDCQVVVHRECTMKYGTPERVEIFVQEVEVP